MCILRRYSEITNRQSNSIYRPLKHTRYVVTAVIQKTARLQSLPFVTLNYKAEELLLYLIYT